MSVPTKDTLLVSYSTNMNNRLIASGVSMYHLTAGRVSQYTAKHEAFIEAYTALTTARDAGDWSQTQTMLKAQAKEELLGAARTIYAIVSGDPDVSDTDKVALGIHLRPEPVSIPRPNVRPGMHLTGASGRTVTGTIHDNSVEPHRAKPPGSVSAWIYSFVGTDFPANPSAWKFEGSCTGRRFSVAFDDALPAGTQVWLCAAWINAKQEAGPISVPISANLPGGGTLVEAA
jgi:hypothetical protein